MGVSQNQCFFFGGPYNKDYSILGLYWGSPYFGKLPNGFSKQTPPLSTDFEELQSWHWAAVRLGVTASDQCVCSFGAVGSPRQTYAAHENCSFLGPIVNFVF